MTCDQCGVTLEVGSWPWCPHEKLAAAVIDDQLEGGPRWFENLGHEPVWIESKTQLQAEMDKRGLRFMDRWAGESDRHLTNWAAAMDPQTLENARVLLSRGSRDVASSPSTRWETFQQLPTRSVKLSEYGE